MSQRSEKLHRQVDQLRGDVAEMKEHQLTMERFNAALQSVTEADNTRQVLVERRKTRAAQASARAWKLNAILTLILAALAAGVALVVTVKAAATEGPTTPPTEAPTISDDGCLLGNDTPAQEPVRLDQAHVLESVVITHYDVCERCCGKVDGITASGVRATPYSTVSRATSLGMRSTWSRPVNMWPTRSLKHWGRCRRLRFGSDLILQQQ